MKRVASRLMLAVLLVLAATGMVLQAGSVPHLHAGTEPGIYNEEHDLTLLAGLASHVVLADVSLTITVDAVSSPLSSFVPERPVLHGGHSGDSRAPPLS
jgi:hypothetical protein